jgi:hypothetical protein
MSVSYAKPAKRSTACGKKGLDKSDFSVYH